MLSNPIIVRELSVIARRAATYCQRALMAVVMLIALGANYAAWIYWNEGQFTIRQISQFARTAFGLFVLAQVVLTTFLVPEFVAARIAEERDRRTLPYLLTSRLTNAQIVLGKLGSALLNYLACLASGLPIMTLLPILGGIDPRMVMLAYAGTLSIAFFLAGLSFVASITAPRASVAVRNCIIISVAWLVVPILVPLLGSRIIPRLYPWIRPINEFLLASSPTGVMASAIGFLPRGPFLETMARMIALQVGSGICLIVLAVFRLRAACRRFEGGGRLLFRRTARPRARWRLWPRPACGDDPILWKELHTGGTRGIARLWGILASSFCFIILGLLTVFYAVLAFEEAITTGFVPSARSPHREQFGVFLRMVTAVINFIYVLYVAGTAAETIATERSRETWTSLLTTPLSGREILRGKRLGIAVRSSGFAVALIVLWTTGLLSGAIHPLGVLAALLELAVSVWFLSALGVYCSLVTRDLRSASNAALVPALALATSGLIPLLVPSMFKSVWLGTLSFPFLEALVLVTYQDVQVGLMAVSPSVQAMGIPSGEPTIALVATYLIGLTSATIGAHFFTRAGDAQFDRAVGRPHRALASQAQPSSEPGEPVAVVSA